MKEDQKNADALFDSLRNSPTELSLEEVNQLIEVLPSMPKQANDIGNSANLFNLNNIIMISIPVSIAIALLTMYNWSEKPQVVEPIALIQESISMESTPIENSEMIPPAIENVIEEKRQDTTTEKITPILTEQINIPSEIEEKPVEPSPQNLTIKDDNEVKSTEDKNYIEYNIPSSKPKTVVQNEAVDNDIPKITSKSLKRLKRTLYQNLVADKLIKNKRQYVMMELPGNEIIVNDKPLNEQLYAKYTEITRQIGTGKYRKIEMSPAFIKMGNFTDKGFKGHGIGTFTVPEGDHFNQGHDLFQSDDDLDLGEDDLMFNNDELFDQEKEELRKFAKSILDKKEKRVGKKSLIAVHIKDNKIKSLYDDLYYLLLIDGLIESPTDFVLIELPENEIWVNGQLLTKEAANDYENLLAENKIKHGPIRMIRLSEHLIMIGDFSIGEFTGTSAVYE